MRTDGPAATPKPKDLLVILVASFASVLLIWWFISRFSISSWDFRNNLWAPAHLLLNGRSPYDISVLFDGSGAVWMPPVIGAFFPLGWLSLSAASKLWFALNVASLIGIVVLSARPDRPKPLLLGVLLILHFTFPPVLAHLRLGQISLLAVFVVVACVNYIHRLPIPVLSTALAITLAKPQLIVLVLPGLLFWRNNVKRRRMSLAVGVLLAAAALTLPLFIGYSDWVADFRAAQDANPNWAQPSSLFTLRTAWGAAGIAVWAIMASGAFFLNLRLWSRFEPSIAAMWSLALTPLVVPYIWSWDFVVILPLISHALFRAGSRSSRTILISGYIFCSAWIIQTLLNGETPSNHIYWWIPWFLLGLVVVSRFVERIGRSDLITGNNDELGEGQVRREPKNVTVER
jgi:hypothetical protein